MLWFHSSAFSNFWKIGKFSIPFPKFLKTLFKKWKNSFQKIGEQFWKPSNFPKFVKGR